MNFEIQGFAVGRKIRWKKASLENYKLEIDRWLLVRVREPAGLRWGLLLEIFSRHSIFSSSHTLSLSNFSRIAGARFRNFASAVSEKFPFRRRSPNGYYKPHTLYRFLASQNSLRFSNSLHSPPRAKFSPK